MNFIRSTEKNMWNILSVIMEKYHGNWTYYKQSTPTKILINDMKGFSEEILTKLVIVNLICR